MKIDDLTCSVASFFRNQRPAVYCDDARNPTERARERKRESDGNRGIDKYRSKKRTTYLGPPSTGEGRRLSGTLVLALGLNEALPVGFCDEALPDVLLPVDTELTVEAIRLSGRQSKRSHVVEPYTTQALCNVEEGLKRGLRRKGHTQQTAAHTQENAHRLGSPKPSV